MLNKNRAQSFGAVEALTRHSQATHEARGSSQNSLFGDDTAQRRPQLPKVPDWSPMERLQNEFSAIGFYLSSHPLAAYERSLERLKVTRAADLQALLSRGVPGRIKLAGTVIDRAERTSAKGQPLRLRAVLRPVGGLRAHGVQRTAGQQAQPPGAGAGDPWCRPTAGSMASR